MIFRFDMEIAFSKVRADVNFYSDLWAIQKRKICNLFVYYGFAYSLVSVTCNTCKHLCNTCFRHALTSVWNIGRIKKPCLLGLGLIRILSQNSCLSIPAGVTVFNSINCVLYVPCVN